MGLANNRRRISIFVLRTTVMSIRELGISNSVVGSGVDARDGDGCGIRLRTLSRSKGTSPVLLYADLILGDEKAFACAAAYAESLSAF